MGGGGLPFKRRRLASKQKVLFKKKRNRKTLRATISKLQPFQTENVNV